MDIKPVIVQALFDIKRDKWNHFTMSYHTYLHWMRNVLSLDNPIVIYTEEKFFKAIFDNRKVFDPKMEKTRIIVQETKDLTAYKLFYKRLDKLMQTQEFKGNAHFDVPEMTKPLYNTIMFNKLYWLRHARDSNFFNGNVYVWKAAGTYREELELYAHKKWPDPKKIDMSQPTFFSHHEEISIHNIKHHAFSQMRFIHGTCFFVPNDSLDYLISEMEYTIDESLKQQYIGSDEKMFDITYLRAPQNYKLIKSNWREYFPLFSW